MALDMSHVTAWPVPCGGAAVGRTRVSLNTVPNWDAARVCGDLPAAPRGPSPASERKLLESEAPPIPENQANLAGGRVPLNLMPVSSPPVPGGPPFWAHKHGVDFSVVLFREKAYPQLCPQNPPAVDSHAPHPPWSPWGHTVVLSFPPIQAPPLGTPTCLRPSFTLRRSG